MQSPSELGTEHLPADPGSRDAETGWLDPITGDILLQVMTELASMMSILGRASAGRRIAETQACARALLHDVARCIMAREINPWTRLRMSPDEPALSPTPSAARIGVFPLSANPIHWGHLLSALSVMARVKLDKVLFVICSDSSPAAELYPEELRRGAALEATGLFQPLFTLVPQAAGKTTSGPSALFRLLGLNGQQMVEAFYLASREPGAGPSVEITDALWGKSTTAPASRNERLHPVSVVMMEPSVAEPHPAAQIGRLMTVPQALPWISTPAVRSALRTSMHRDELAALPACAFRHLRMLTAFD